jgi:hypothetical protein
MKERIKELAEQAEQWNADGDKCEVNLQKFAELIVKECMKESWEEIVADEDIALEKDPLIREYILGNNQGIVDAVIRFRNHFGVEE